jgi:hypothetical protein
MTNATDPLEAGFVRIIHPVTGGIADVQPIALPQHYAGGWVRLTTENAPEADAAPGEPAPMTETQVREGLAKPAKSAAKTRQSAHEE